MSGKLQIVFILASILTFVLVITKIRKQGMNIDKSIVWILWSILLLIISVFPKLADFISSSLGFMTTSNFIFTLFIFFLYIMLFDQVSQISKLQEKQKELIQKLSIKEYRDQSKK